MSEDNDIDPRFKVIDQGIDKFNQDKGFYVDADPKSDWLVFDWRQITWSADGVDYLIEIYPHFNTDENIESWSLYTAATIDVDDKRCHLTNALASKVDLNFIVNNINSLLTEAYTFIVHIKREEILASPSTDLI